MQSLASRVRTAMTISKAQARLRTMANSIVRLALRLFFVILLIQHPDQIFGQTVITPFQCESLTHQFITIPTDTKGKFTLICLASSTRAQKDLESWLDPLYQKFIAKSGLMDDAFDVNLYFIPVITGSKLFAENIKSKFNENTQIDIKPHILFASTDNKAVLNSLSLQEDNIPHFILFNEKGEIIFRTNGPYTEEKLDIIDDLISG